MKKIGNGRLTLADFAAVVRAGDRIELEAEALEKVRDSYRFLREFARDKIIYGINTGFGPMAQYRVEDEKGRQLQLNLIRSHAAGSGDALSDSDVRALMLCRLNTLMLGYSGVHQSTVDCLVALLNERLIPFIPEHGGVGASGDLVQLAHLAYTMIGEGEVVQSGARLPLSAVQGFDDLPLAEIHIREGLAIMNGTAAMTGIGLNNVLKAHRLLTWSTLLSAVINEVMESYDDHVSQELNQSKKHRGQQAIAGAMRKVFAGSKSVKQRHEELYKGSNGERVFKDKVQEYYSLRCVPQILGPVLDGVRNAERILLEEVNSANDNPIIDTAAQHVFHGGNFHGDYVAFEMDKLKIGVTKLSMLAERQLNYLLNSKLNEKLPPFLNSGQLGFNYGLQGMQFTATSTTAENQMLSNPMYVHSIPNNGDNQDVVSMGTNAALAARRVIENAFQVMAIEAIAVCQAVDCSDSRSRLSPQGAALYDEVRKRVPARDDDKEGYTAIASVVDWMQQEELMTIEV